MHQIVVVAAAAVARSCYGLEKHKRSISMLLLMLYLNKKFQK